MVTVSIIIVHYKVLEPLISCLQSIRKYAGNISYEVIVVDNDEKNVIEKKLHERFPETIYLKSKKNKGFGAGNNLGAKHAKGKFLFFLNPDTEIFEGTLDTLVAFATSHKDAGIVAPLLLDIQKKPYPLQGTRSLGFLEGVIALSFINKFFPNNPISKKFWLFDWDKKSTQKVDVVPGTAFVIKKDIFERLRGFDERFFLYFEEYDLCRRVNQLGYDLYILPHAKVKHIWGASTRNLADRDEIFKKSRFLYFQKHIGLLQAIVIDAVTRFNKIFILLTCILFLSFVLRFYRLSELMPFIGDQGWFYLSARDMLLTGHIPLVGITASHTWLHQGPLWTYILGVLFFLFHFDPIAPGYFTAFIGLVTVLGIYGVAREFFSRRIGIISALLYATSPLVIIHSRMPYHTSLIPIVTLIFFYLLYKWIEGKKDMFPFIILSLAILYNLELATAVLWFVLFFCCGYGFWRNKKWAKNIMSKKVLLFSFFYFLISMLPIILYDATHGFAQTAKFVGWIGYHTMKSMMTFGTSGNFLPSIREMLMFFATYYQRLVFVGNEIIALLIFIFSFGFLLWKLYQDVKKKAVNLSHTIVWLWILIPFVGFILNKTPSEAYLPLFFPVVCIAIAIFFDALMGKTIFSYLSIFCIVVIVSFNTYSLYRNNFFMGSDGLYGPYFSKRIEVAKSIVDQSNGRRYNLFGRGPGCQFDSFTMNYQYLTWYFGNEPSKKLETRQFVITEHNGMIDVSKKDVANL